MSGKWQGGDCGAVCGKMCFRGLWKKSFVTFRAGWSFHGPAVSLGSVHSMKKFSLGERDMILENVLGGQPVLECKGISGVRGQDVRAPRVQILGTEHGK